MKFKDYYKKKDLKLTYGEKLLDKYCRKLKITDLKTADGLLDMVWEIEDYYKKVKR
jgi:hypothetical protein